MSQTDADKMRAIEMETVDDIMKKLSPDDKNDVLAMFRDMERLADEASTESLHHNLSRVAFMLAQAHSVLIGAMRSSGVDGARRRVTEEAAFLFSAAYETGARAMLPELEARLVALLALAEGAGRSEARKPKESGGESHG